MANSHIVNRNEWFFDPFGNMGGGYTGAGGGAGGAIAGGLAAAGAALAGQIVNHKTKEWKDQQLADLGKPNLDYPETPSKTEEKPLIPEGIPTNFENIGKQELPYLPNAGSKPNTEVKPNLDGIPTNFENIGKQELPYLPNSKTETTDKDMTITANPLYPPEGQEEIKDPIPSPSIIPDETGKNEEIAISPTFDMQNMYDFILQQQQRQWDREDAIRAETQAREDNAWQRAVEDMRKAGVNPNLVNAGPAESGGGITSATGLNYAPWESEVNKNLALLEQEINNAFKEDEATKDRITEMITSILSMFTFATITKGK